MSKMCLGEIFDFFLNQSFLNLNYGNYYLWKVMNELILNLNISYFPVMLFIPFEFFHCSWVNRCTFHCDPSLFALWFTSFY